jgi:hypothetical protein
VPHSNGVNFETVQPVADIREEIALVQRETERMLARAAIPASLPPLGHLLYLHRYDEVLGTRGETGIGQLLGEVFTRAVWLLEKLGQGSGQEVELVHAVRTLVESFEHAASSLNLNREELISVLDRIQSDRNQLPMIRGAAAGGLARHAISPQRGETCQPGVER